MVICLYQMWIIRRVVLFTICTTDSTTSGIYVHWPVTTMIIGATTATQTYLKILCVISILCHLCLEIARIPPRNNSNDASPQFFICFHSPELPKLKNLLFAVHICCLRNSALFFAQFPGTPDKSQIRILFSWVAFKTPWNNIFVRPKLLLLQGFKIPQNNQFRPPKAKLWAWKFKARFELS